ncbi:uncharacterized protein LOC127463655 isoform X2 [Manacus candei]|uniref:uncharacterized protein LOC127463655 isoform X2 n=1 Tax=Manacus candei TaxID=415023 RepID=UPI0022279FD5|nr:uncharacterized protein LOC127463655 isoform X2 [Manacus candei]
MGFKIPSHPTHPMTLCFCDSVPIRDMELCSLRPRSQWGPAHPVCPHAVDPGCPGARQLEVQGLGVSLTGTQGCSMWGQREVTTFRQPLVTVPVRWVPMSPWQPTAGPAGHGGAGQDRASRHLLPTTPEPASSPGDWDLDPDSVLPGSTVHEQLLLEEKVKQFEEAKKKTKSLHKQLQQQFLKDQERKMEWKKKAEEQFKKSLEVFDRRSGKVPARPTRPSAAAEAKPKKPAAAADKKKSKRRV